jgi:hypothetical protein
MRLECAEAIASRVSNILFDLRDLFFESRPQVKNVGPVREVRGKAEFAVAEGRVGLLPYWA